MILLQVLINLGKLLNCVHCIKGYCIFSIANPRSLTSRMDTLDKPGHVVLLRLRAFPLPDVRSQWILADPHIYTRGQAHRTSIYYTGPLPSMKLFYIRRRAGLHSRAEMVWLLNLILWSLVVAFHDPKAR